MSANRKLEGIAALTALVVLGVLVGLVSRRNEIGKSFEDRRNTCSVTASVCSGHAAKRQDTRGAIGRRI